MWLEEGAGDPVFTETLRLDMSSVEPSLAGPKRPQDKVLLSAVDDEFRTNFTTEYGHPGRGAARAVRGRRAQCRRRQIRYRPWRRRDRRDHLVHQHLQPLRAGRRRPGRAQGARARARFQALGEDQPRARLAGGHRLSRPRRPFRGSERDRLRSGRLWLHHLHRQFGAAARGDQRLDPRERRGRGQRPLRQPQFRGPGLARRARQLSRLAALGRRLCAQRDRDRGHGRYADRQGQRRQRRLSQGHLADRTRKSAR